MKITERVYPSGEVAFILRQALGDMRSWDDCLADMRSGKTNVCGCVLEPVIRLFNERAWRPTYAWSDIATFIRAVSAATAEAKVRLPMQGKVITYDTAVDWRAQRIKARRIPATWH